MSLALAADPAPAPNDSTAQAREAFTIAQKLYKQARYSEAAAKFEETFVLRPHPVIQYNIGRCYEALGELTKALRAYKDYLRLMPEAEDKVTVNDAVVNIERRMQDKGVQQVLVYAEPSSATISVDGKVLGGSPASTELKPGNHQVSVTAPDHDPMQRAFVLTAQRSVQMSLALKPTGGAVGADAPKATPATAFRADEFSPPPPPPSVSAETPRARVATWVVGGAAIVAAGIGAVLFGVQAGIRSDIVRRERPGDEVARLLEQANGLQLSSFIAFGVAGAALVTAVLLFFLEGR